MNIETLKQEWYPLCKIDELKTKPLKKILLDQAIVLVRLQKEVSCFEDRCPHRNVPLSDAKVVGKHLQCHYHGWEYDSKGKLKKMAGCEKCTQNLTLKSYATHLAKGLIWVRLEGDKKFHQLMNTPQGMTSLIKCKTLNADYIHAIENFLDPLHTPFIHKGLLRTASPQRMQVSQTHSEHGFQTTYHLKDQQNGLINRLFDSGIDINIATFEMPGYAKIAYYKQNHLLFEVGIFFVPLTQGSVSMVVQASLQKSWIPSSLKFLLLQPFLEMAFAQDAKILASQYQSKENHPYMTTEYDLVIEHLLYLFEETKDERMDAHLDLVL